MYPSDAPVEFFGWEQVGGEGTTSAAWWPNVSGASIRLNDAYAVMGFGTGSIWDLTSVVDANNSRRILVRGAKSGSERAVLLVPQLVQP
jgi:hypothetical protein